ncbi:hypothetical protein [Tomitella fengzijianii]|uniref:hypothetical protein n=1 Tax=Tomitella fengzijianii TaxID=2597660 RepID=UPI003555DC0A
MSRPLKTPERAGAPACTGTLGRQRLASLVPELLLAGHLIDRAAMPHVLARLGREGMTAVAIEEWLAASPVYTRRMQQALGFPGADVPTVFKGMQLDIGAPPQFMDFRYQVHDARHGAFHLDHCGALLDVEPMGPDYVTAMCHDIEDPTFDGTAAATNPRARCRPVHRPPRAPADRTPHCEWTVTIDEDAPPAPYPPQAAAMDRTEAARVPLDRIVPGSGGRDDYAGPLLADLRWDEWSGPALHRMAQEIALQGHMLVLGSAMALRNRLDARDVQDILLHQCTGIAAVTSDRLCTALDLPRNSTGLAELLAIHPALTPYPYVGARVVPGPEPVLELPQDSPAVRDGAWPALLATRAGAPALDALVRGVDPRFSTHIVSGPEKEGGAAGRRVVRIAIRTDARPHPESDDAALTRFSGGAGFAFDDARPSLPLTVVGSG